MPASLSKKKELINALKIAAPNRSVCQLQVFKINEKGTD